MSLDTEGAKGPSLEQMCDDLDSFGGWQVAEDKGRYEAWMHAADEDEVQSANSSSVAIGSLWRAMAEWCEAVDAAEADPSARFNVGDRVLFKVDGHPNIGTVTVDDNDRRILGDFGDYLSGQDVWESAVLVDDAYRAAREGADDEA